MLNRTIDPKELAKLEKEERPFSYDPTLEEWLLYWLDTFIFPVCRPSTCMNFRSYITAHICPLLGDYHLMELRPVMLQYFVRHQLEQGRLDHSGGLARKTVMEQFNVLSRALRKAVAMGYLEYDPSQAVELPEKEQHEQRTLTIQEQQRVSQAVDPTWQTSSLLPVLLGEYAGLRIGEIAGLQIGDIDLKRRRIHVQRSLNRTLPQDVDGTCRSCLHYGRTKNGRTRYVPMSDDLYNALSVYMDTMPADMRKRGSTAVHHLQRESDGAENDPLSFQQTHEAVVDRGYPLPFPASYLCDQSYGSTDEPQGVQPDPRSFLHPDHCGYLYACQ